MFCVIYFDNYLNFISPRDEIEKNLENLNNKIHDLNNSNKEMKIKIQTMEAKFKKEMESKLNAQKREMDLKINDLNKKIELLMLEKQEKK